jgi:hypothetical protein
MRWSTGAAEVERLLAKGHVERVQGAPSDSPARPGAMVGERG